MVADNGEEIFDQTRSGLTCDRRVGQEKFLVTYEVEHCAEFQGRSKISKGGVTVTATTEDGDLVSSRTLKCNQ